jgi:hypothetical protein
MISAIDEVGDFGLGSDDLHYFVAVHIDQNQNRFPIKQSQFRLWEENIPSIQREKGEVKGRLLSDEQLNAFYEQVVSTEPKMLISAVGTIPKENTPAAVAVHVRKEVAALTRVIEHHTEHGNASARTYKALLIWYKNLSNRPDMFLKLKCLEELIRISLPYTLGYAQLQCYLDGGDETNLQHTAFKIDKDYVRARNTMIFWREHLRQSLMHTRGPLEVPLLPFWTREEAPLHRHYPLVGAQGVNLRNLFLHRVNFFDSKDHWEVRLADVFATVLHRIRNRKRLLSLEADIEQRMNPTIGNTKHIVFGAGSE